MVVLNEKQIEQQIRDVLATEGQALALSNRLFSPDGLFCQLAQTEQERRLVAQSPLFKQAQRRLTELQQKEGAAFTQAVQRAGAALQSGDYWLKLEQSSTQ
jgi:hypothetical protein